MPEGLSGSDDGDTSAATVHIDDGAVNEGGFVAGNVDSGVCDRVGGAAAEGPDAVRTIVGTIRTLYEHQEFNFAGPYGDNGWLEDYTAEVGGEPIGCAVLVTSNDAGQTQHVAANYRPRSSLLLMSQLLGEKFAGTPYAQYFLSSEAP